MRNFPNPAVKHEDFSRTSCSKGPWERSHPVPATRNAFLLWPKSRPNPPPASTRMSIHLDITGVREREKVWGDGVCLRMGGFILGCECMRHRDHLVTDQAFHPTRTQRSGRPNGGEFGKSLVVEYQVLAHNS